MSSSSLTVARLKDVSTEQAGGLLQALSTVPDPRRGGGRRHPLGYVLGVLVMSFACTGFESFTGAAQWAASAPRRLLLALGAKADPLTGAVHAPSEPTIRRVATRIDHGALEAAVAVWTATGVRAVRPVCAGDDRLPVAIDGKTVRGARTGDRSAPHLLAAATHRTPVVLAQRQIPGKTNEIPMVATLLDDLRSAGHDPAGIVFTLDALHTQHATAKLLHDAGAGYVMTVKANQPGLLASIIARFKSDHPTSSTSTSRGHGRTEERQIHVLPATGIGFPGAAQVFRIVRYTGGLDGQRTRKEVVHGITNQTTDQADETGLGGLVRGHWSIENSIHWTRDVTYREDASRVRTGNAPAVLAAVRNIVTTALRLAGLVNVAAARRAAALNPSAALRLFTRPPNQDKRPL